MSIQTIEIIIGLAAIGGLLFSTPVIIKIFKIWRTPTHWVSDLPEKGRIEVLGKVGQKTILSPMNQKPCALWQVEVKQEKQGRHGTYWETIYKHASKEPFDLNDDTGTIGIQPEHVDLILDDVVESSILHVEQKKKLEEFGIKLTNFWGSEKNLEVCEHLIEPDKEVYVNGEIQTNDGQKVISGHLGDSLIISDRKEADLLSGFYRKVGYNLLIAAALAAVIIFAILRTH
jgi:hypothetical protein